MPSLKIIGLLVLEKKIFKGFFSIYRHGGHLGHVTWTIYVNFLSLLPRRLHIKFGFDWPSGFRGFGSGELKRGCLKLFLYVYTLLCKVKMIAGRVKVKIYR